MRYTFMYFKMVIYVYIYILINLMFLILIYNRPGIHHESSATI
jgi:hypothetical protein